MKDPFAKPSPPPAVDSSVAILAALDQLRAAIENAPKPAAPVVEVPPVDLTEIVTAVQNLNGPATADEIAAAIARELRRDEPADDGVGATLAEVADALKKLDFRLQGVGTQAYGGGAVSFSKDGLAQLTKALSAIQVSGGGGVSDEQLLAIAALEPTADQVPFFTALDTADVATLTAYARTFIAAADAGAARAVLELGDAALADAADFEAAGAVDAAIAALVDTAPGTLDTLNELAAALGDDADFAATMTTALAGKQPLDADLTAIAALTTTAYGRAFLALADAAAGRTALGLGTAATSNTGDFDAAGAAASAQAASQPLDSDLTAIAALSTTSFGRSLLEAANAAALRTLAGLGTAATSATTDFQAADAELAAIAGLTSAADKVPYFTGSGTAALATQTAFARTLLDDADASTARGTLGLGTAATAASTDFAPFTPTVGTGLSTTGTVNLDMAALNGTYQDIAMSGNITFTTSNLAAGVTTTIRLTAASTRTLTFPAWVFVGGTPTQLLAGKTGVLTVTSFSTSDANVVASWASST